MSKLYIHETDYHGGGNIIFENKIEPYAWDIDADVKQAVEKLISVGFINPDDVIIIEKNEIYDYLKEE